MIAFMTGGTFFRVLYAYSKSDILKISKSIGFFLIFSKKNELIFLIMLSSASLE